MISVSAKTTHMLLIAAGLRLSCGHRAEIAEGHAQPVGHDFEEPPRAGGTAVVHGEIAHPAVAVQAHELAVLAADIDDGPGVGDEMTHAHRVAGDLGDRRVGDARWRCGRSRWRRSGGRRTGLTPLSASVFSNSSQASLSCSIP